MKNKGIIKSILKAEISNNVFYRIININELNETINISIYKEILGTNNLIQYKKVLPDELPISIVSKLSLENNYSKVTKEEAEMFLNKLQEIQSKVKENNSFNEFEYLSIDNVCDINYILCKEKEVNYYCLASLKLNEFGVVERQGFINSLEIPYVLMDILEKNNFAKITIFLGYDYFVRIIKEEDKYLCIIYNYVINNKKPAFKIVDAYTLVEGQEEFYLIRDMDNELAIKLDDECIKKYNEDFFKTI